MTEQGRQAEIHQEEVARLESVSRQALELVAQAAHGDIIPGFGIDSCWISNPSFGHQPLLSFPHSSVLVIQLQPVLKPNSTVNPSLEVFYYPPTAQGKIGSIFRFLRISSEQSLTRIRLTTPHQQFDILRRGNQVIPAEAILDHSPLYLHFSHPGTCRDILPQPCTLVPNRLRPEEVLVVADILETIVTGR